MKRVYFFGGKRTEGNSQMRALLGNKGANLAEMSQIGIPVPPGFTITTAACQEFYDNGQELSQSLKTEVLENLHEVESLLGQGLKFGSKTLPLLVSVRSGAPVSMPGMMDTVLNLGLSQKALPGLIKSVKTPDSERFAWDSYRRLLQMYGSVVMDVSNEHLNDCLDREKSARGVASDTELRSSDWQAICLALKAIIQRDSRQNFPEDDAYEQLWGAIRAVFRSWNSKRAVEYRRIEKIPHEGGTAVTVQAMVFGNMGENCATGVAFTRDPSTGRKVFFGEYLQNAQGEDVVAGIRTPVPINRDSLRNGNGNHGSQTLEAVMPNAYRELEIIYQKLESHYRDMQDIEFTVQNNQLWLLQTRNGKRTARAALKIALDLVEEGVITPREAIARVTPEQLEQLLHPSFDPQEKKRAPLLAVGLPASPGAATGAIYFSADEAAEAKLHGKRVILVRNETSPEDIHGMNAAEGIITTRGGMTSHAAVVARGMGRVCIVGCATLRVDAHAKTLEADTKNGFVRLREGDILSLDGSSGEIYGGELRTIASEMTPEFTQFMKWCDGVRKLKVRANADQAADVKIARAFGAEGIGLCRTEHMFFGEARIPLIRQMILARSEAERLNALEAIEPLQREDFIAIFREMKGFPVTVRLLDPPLHEFLPRLEFSNGSASPGDFPAEIWLVAERLGLSAKDLRRKIEELMEVNPMLGHRGCRLGITYPEIYESQTRAIMEAAVYLAQNENYLPEPEIMIPLVGSLEEFRILRDRIDAVCRDVLEKARIKLPYLIGTMVELPRAALTADQISSVAEFFSFGTNDLTQMTLGISRDDSSHFLPAYLAKGIFREDPFVSIDQAGVGELIRIGVERGRATRKNLKCGICGEHGGDPKSIRFCHGLALDYVSCSPYRVPLARLAAAQAALGNA